MKKFAFGFACVLAGSIAGAAIPRVTAQAFAPANATRWHQVCVKMDTAGRESTVYQNVNGILATRGNEGWELVTVADWNGGTTVCFKRPAP